jgi:Flp pilus assembly protein TadG
MIQQLLRKEHGQSLVEMALVTMLLLSLVGGIVDFGGAFHHYIIITNAAREGARQGSRIPCVTFGAFTTAVVSAALAEAEESGVALVAGDVAVNGSGCPKAGDELAVTVTFNYTPILGGILGIDEFPIRNSVKMVFFGNDQG